MAVDEFSVAQACEDFSCVARAAVREGRAVICEDDRPKYMLIDLDGSPVIDMTEDEKIDFVAARILKRFKPAFLELAK